MADIAKNYKNNPSDKQLKRDSRENYKSSEDLKRFAIKSKISNQIIN